MEKIQPPHKRTPIWRHLTEAAASGRCILQRCKQCQQVQYPPREVCHNCLSDELNWDKLDATGELLAETIIQFSSNPYFREHGPLRVGLVKLDCGVRVYAHLSGRVEQCGERIRLLNRLDLSDESVFIAVPVDSKDDDISSELTFIQDTR